ncbi:MAG: phosphoribosylamine--glycine ligase [Sarcina sp.]
MKIIIIGSGAREHAIARKIAKNDKVKKIYCIPGNAGTFLEDKCQNINLDENKEILKFAMDKNIDLTIVGPEKPLVEGIVDDFTRTGLKIFGPKKNAAMLEGSKAFSKEFMKKYKIKTASYETFYDSDKAIEYIKKQELPIVIKADGLASGKGVYICKSIEEATCAIDEIMVQEIFKGAGSKIVIEAYLEGIEASILSICDGKTIIPFISAKDHKQIYDGDLGPNTGGMGIVAPNPYFTSEFEAEFNEKILKPTLKGIKNEFEDFCGIIFFGIMMTKTGTYLLEYNVRMGDPETQSVLELMESDFLNLIECAVDRKLDKCNVKWKNKISCNIVLAVQGYPSSFDKNIEINFDKKSLSGTYFAGAVQENNKILTSGGRVITIVGTGDTIKEAREQAYKKQEAINFKGKYFRTDIGK